MVFRTHLGRGSIQLLARLFTIGTALLLLVAGILKAYDPAIATLSLRGVGLGQTTARLAVLLLVLAGIEVGLGARLIVTYHHPVALRLASALFFAFCAFLIVLWIHNPEADCGCFAALDRWWATAHPLWAVMRSMVIGILLLCASMCLTQGAVEE
ncbi:MAG: MauE/DoxX family redox-associated membrane protein [Phycisphaerales bacterium]